MTVGVSATVSGIDAQLAPGSGISGRVTAPSGTGLPDVGITVYRWETTGFARFDSFTTDSAGYYEAKGLTSGSYRLELYAWNWEVGEYWNDKANLADATTISLITTHVVHLRRRPGPGQGSWAVKNLAPPVITGTPRVGQTMTASSGLWSPSDVTVTYQWRAGGVSIPGGDRPGLQPDRR